MATKKRKSRDGHAKKTGAKEPAKFESSEDAGAPPANPVSFDAKAIAERLNIWWLNGKPTYFTPMLAGDDWREMSVQDLRRVLRANGVRMKPDEGPRLIQPKAGDWSLIREILGRLDDPDTPQLAL